MKVCVGCLIKWQRRKGKSRPPVPRKGSAFPRDFQKEYRRSIGRHPHFPRAGSSCGQV